MKATDIRNNKIIIFDGELCRVLDFHHNTPGKGPASVQVKLRNLRSGTQFEHKFRSSDSVDLAFIEVREMEYLYGDGTAYHFMNTESYEQYALSAEDLGDQAKWLSEGMKIQVQLFEGNPLGVELPKSIVCTVAETQPMVKGATAASSAKPATLENGVVINVPNFIEDGTDVVVDPVEGKYLERAK